MKKTVFMPVFIAIFALTGAVLRGLNLMHGYEAATKLPVPGDKAEMALIAVCGLAALALVILAGLACIWPSPRTRSFRCSINCRCFRCGCLPCSRAAA